MRAAASGKSNIGIPRKVGQEFSEADPGGKLPKHAKDSSSMNKLDAACAKMDDISSRLDSLEAKCGADCRADAWSPEARKAAAEARKKHSVAEKHHSGQASWHEGKINRYGGPSSSNIGHGQAATSHRQAAQAHKKAGSTGDPEHRRHAETASARANSESNKKFDSA